MDTRLRLTSLTHNTQFAPLAVLGYCLQRTDFFAPLRQDVHLGSKTLVHTPHEKLLDVVVSILTGCTSIKHINTRLRPDLTLAHAWGREQFAHQATIADTLDAFNTDSLDGLRTATTSLLRQHSQVIRHDFAASLLMLDNDLTGLPASRHAQGSCKGFFSGEKTVTGVKWRA